MEILSAHSLNFYHCLITIKDNSHNEGIWSPISSLHPGLNFIKSLGERCFKTDCTVICETTNLHKERDNLWWHVIKITWSDHGHHTLRQSLSSPTFHRGEWYTLSRESVTSTLYMYNDLKNWFFIQVHSRHF